MAPGSSTCFDFYLNQPKPPKLLSKID